MPFPNPHQEPVPAHSQIIHLINLFPFSHQARKAKEHNFMEEIRLERTKERMVASLWEDKTKAWLGWRAEKGTAWGRFSSENGAVLNRVNCIHYLALTGRGGSPRKPDWLKRQEAEQMWSNPWGRLCPLKRF